MIAFVHSLADDEQIVSQISTLTVNKNVSRKLNFEDIYVSIAWYTKCKLEC